MLVHVDRFVWAKECHEQLGSVYASVVARGPTVDQVRAEVRLRKLEAIQIRICAPRDLSTTSFASWRKKDPLTLHRDLGERVSLRDLAQLLCKSVEASNIEDEYGILFQVFYGVLANTRSAWSIANARQVVGYEPEVNSEVVYTDEIRELMLGSLRVRSWSRATRREATAAAER